MNNQPLFCVGIYLLFCYDMTTFCCPTLTYEVYIFCDWTTQYHLTNMCGNSITTLSAILQCYPYHTDYDRLCLTIQLYGFDILVFVQLLMIVQPWTHTCICWRIIEVNKEKIFSKISIRYSIPYYCKIIAHNLWHNEDIGDVKTDL